MLVMDTWCACMGGGVVDTWCACVRGRGHSISHGYLVLQGAATGCYRVLLQGSLGLLDAPVAPGCIMP